MLRKIQKIMFDLCLVRLISCCLYSPINDLMIITLKSNPTLLHSTENQPFDCQTFCLVISNGCLRTNTFSLILLDFHAIKKDVGNYFTSFIMRFSSYCVGTTIFFLEKQWIKLIIDKVRWSKIRRAPQVDYPVWL